MRSYIVAKYEVKRNLRFYEIVLIA
jgi:hypothetical protein